MMRTPEHLTHDGARQLAGRLTAYWRERGHDVTAWTEVVTEGRDKLRVYAVRSNLINGLPRKMEKNL